MCCFNPAREEFSFGTLQPECKMSSGSKTTLFIVIGGNFVLSFCVCFLYKVWLVVNFVFIPACGYCISSDKTQHRCKCHRSLALYPATWSCSEGENSTMCSTGKFSQYFLFSFTSDISIIV